MEIKLVDNRESLLVTAVLPLSVPLGIRNAARINIIISLATFTLNEILDALIYCISMGRLAPLIIFNVILS